jgi:hypothetical protein
MDYLAVGARGPLHEVDSSKTPPGSRLGTLLRNSLLQLQSRQKICFGAESGKGTCLSRRRENVGILVRADLQTPSAFTCESVNKRLIALLRALSVFHVKHRLHNHKSFTRRQTTGGSRQKQPILRSPACPSTIRPPASPTKGITPNDELACP